MSTNRLFCLLLVGLLFAVMPLAACSPQATLTPTATPAPQPTATADAKQALDGSWTSTVTKEDLVRVMPGIPQQYLCENAGTFVVKFNVDGTFTVDQTALPDCPAPANPHVEDKWSLEGNVITFAKGTPNQEIYEISIDSGQLIYVKAKSSDCPPCMAVNTANPWTRVE